METKNRGLLRCIACMVIAAVLVAGSYTMRVTASELGRIEAAGMLDIHVEASEASEVAGQVMDEGHVAILGKADGWVQIKAGDLIGWVPQENLVETDLTMEEACEENEKIIAEYMEEAMEVVSVAETDADMNSAEEEQELAAYGVSAEEEQELAACEPSAEEVKLLASLIYCEAKGEPYVGKVAVGNVVLNRVESDQYPDTIREVIYDSGQFTPVKNGSMEKALQNGSADESCYMAAFEALAGAEPIGEKTSFRRVNGRSGLVIGNHVFY